MQLKGLKTSEWEEDKNWLAHRMQFIWDYRNLFTDDYLKNGMAEELQCCFYGINDPDVSRLAAQLDSYTEEEVNKFNAMSDNQIKSEYERLSKLSNQSVMQRENRMLYIYILENKHDVVFGNDYD